MVFYFSTTLLLFILSSVIADKDISAIPLRGRSLESKKVFDVFGYGAHGDGHHDDTKAIARTWAAACSAPQPAAMLIPRGKGYLIKHVTLSGPCKSSIMLMIEGTSMAPPKGPHWSNKTNRHWIMFSDVNELTITGGGTGTIDGNGKTWWQNSCKINSRFPCKQAPRALTFYSCKNLRLENVKIVNSQQIHISIEDCRHVKIARLSITAPGTRPNTDGIHVTRSKHVQVTDCRIKTGDDCMSIEDGTENLHVRNIVCRPGMGSALEA
ncbi:hypothetical protein HU200_040771 [Digitaria exilis]|uniref:Polygalacturonase n=1 Tax=Digitaria exilis TaxID=1010633 RepID=A0A835EDW8_9POAL|nr:hypothetical protein HU200_040771 [Digitaria exilis]